MTNRAQERGSRGPYGAGVRRRQHLVEAVLRIIGRDGVAAVTHRSVAREAEVSLGATTYYFETKEAMIREAFACFASLEFARIDEIDAPHERGSGRDLGTVVRGLVEILFRELADPVASFRCETELVLAASREPALASEYASMQSEFERRLRALLRDLGSSQPLRHARIVLGYVRGFELEFLSRPEDPPKRSRLTKELRELLEALLEA